METRHRSLQQQIELEVLSVVMETGIIERGMTELEEPFSSPQTTTARLQTPVFTPRGCAVFALRVSAPQVKGQESTVQTRVFVLL